MGKLRRRLKAKRKEKQTSRAKRRGIKLKRREKRQSNKSLRQSTRQQTRQDRIMGKQKRGGLRQRFRSNRLENKISEQEAEFLVGQEANQMDAEPKEDFIEEEQEQEEIYDEEPENDEEDFEQEEQEQMEEEGAYEGEEEYETYGGGKALRDIASFTVLAPFLPVMKTILVARGYGRGEGGGMNPSTIVAMFYKHIVQGEQYEGQDYYEHFDGAVAQGMVSGIIQYFRNLKGKQKAGETLSGNETKIISIGDKLNKEYKGQVKKEKERTIGEIFSSYWWILLVVFILYKIN